MCQWLVLVYGVQRHIQQYFSYIMDVSRIGGVKWCIQRKPPTCHRQTLSHVASWTSVVLVELSGVSRENHRPVTDKLYHMLYRIHLTMSATIDTSIFIFFGYINLIFPSRDSSLSNHFTYSI
jgi:hypothetical protein